MYNINYDSIGLWIGDERRRQNIKQKDYILNTGYCAKHISDVENGHTIPSITMAQNLVDALGYSIQVVLVKKGERNE